MAIGGDFNNNSGNAQNNGKLYENTYYSRLKIKNQLGKLQLSISFKSGLLLFTIDEIKEGFKIEPLETIYLSPTKAMILSNEIKKFLHYLNNEEIIEGKAFGVNTGMNEKVSYIGFHATKNKTILITIGKIDGSGNILEQATIDLNKDYHYALEWNDIKSMNVERAMDDSIEIKQISDILDDFARSMNGAYAYAVADLTRYDTARILKKMDPIYDKLGIERKTGNGYSAKPNNFLNNLGNKSSVSNHTSMDDIEDMFDD